MCTKLLVFLVLVCLTVCGSFDPIKFGPFKASVKHIEECPNIGRGDIRVSVRMKRFNRTTIAADFNVTLNVIYDDNISIDFAMAQLTNGGFKQNFFTLRFAKACSGIVQLVPRMWEEVLVAMQAQSCPIPKGFYSAKDFTTNEAAPNVTSFFYNRYRASLEFKKQGKLLGCFNAYANLVPKRKQ